MVSNANDMCKIKLTYNLIHKDAKGLFGIKVAKTMRDKKNSS